MTSTMTEKIDVATPDANSPYELEISMGAGTLELSPGAGDRLVTGTVTYNLDTLKPTVTTNENRVRIEQRVNGLRVVHENLKNDWDLRLGDAPINLTLAVGAAKGNLEFGGLSLTGLKIDQGASDFTLGFSKPNAIALDSIQFSAGAAKSAITGLANANAATMTFKGGAGSLALGFDGELKRDLQVDVTAAAGNVVVNVPRGTSSLVSISGMLAQVDARGDWSGSANRYRMNGSGPTITINMSMSVGRVELTSS